MRRTTKIRITDPAIARQLERIAAKRFRLPQEFAVDEEIVEHIEKYRRPGDSDEEALRRALHAARTENASRMIHQGRFQTRRFRAR